MTKVELEMLTFRKKIYDLISHDRTNTPRSLPVG